VAAVRSISKLVIGGSGEGTLELSVGDSGEGDRI